MKRSEPTIPQEMKYLLNECPQYTQQLIYFIDIRFKNLRVIELFLKAKWIEFVTPDVICLMSDMKQIKTEHAQYMFFDREYTRCEKNNMSEQSAKMEFEVNLKYFCELYFFMKSQNVDIVDIVQGTMSDTIEEMTKMKTQWKSYECDGYLLQLQSVVGEYRFDLVKNMYEEKRAVEFIGRPVENYENALKSDNGLFKMSSKEKGTILYVRIQEKNIGFVATEIFYKKELTKEQRDALKEYFEQIDVLAKFDEVKQ